MNLQTFGDMLAIPFFGLLIYHIYKLPPKTYLHYILLLFGIAGMVIDFYFVFLY